MKRLISILLFLPLLLLADGADFDTVKAQIMSELNLLQSQNNEISRIASQGLGDLVGVSPDNTEAYNVALSARGRFQSIISACSDANSMLSYAMQLTSSLQASTNSASSIDYTSILTDMRNLLYSTFNSVNTINQNTGSMVLLLQSILDALQNMGVGNNSQLVTLLTQIKNILNDDIKPLANWMYDANGYFRSFYSNAVERLSFPDQNVQQDLAAMWEDTLYHMSNIVYGSRNEWGQGDIPYSIDDQLAHVTLGEDFRLSNEGYIQLQNLAFNQRQYLCSVEALQLMQGMTNNANLELTWVTNYLNKIQSPFYYGFNDESPSSPLSKINHFTISKYAAATNFYASPSRISKQQRYTTFRQTFTNYFDRLEIYLLSLNGMFADSDTDTSVLDDNLDQENLDRMIRYATNDLVSVTETYAGVSNFWNTATSAFKGVLDAWNIGEDQGGSSPITLLPSFTLGGIQFEHIHLTTTHFADIADACRVVFTGIWYLVWGALAFKFLVWTVFLLGKTIARVSMLIAVFLH